MEEKYLPIGSVVLLEGGTKKLMITGYCMETEEQPGVLYDYSGCLYPEGLIRSDVTSIFNHDQIKEIFFKGYNDEEGKEFHETLLEDLAAGNLEEADEEEEEDFKYIDSSLTAPQKLDEDMPDKLDEEYEEEVEIDEPERLEEDSYDEIEEDDDSVEDEEVEETTEDEIEVPEEEPVEEEN